MEITKKELEDQLGYKIQNFSTDPMYDDSGKLIGYSLRVQPVQSVEEINITGIIDDRKEDMFNYEEITDEEFQLRMEKYYSDMENLYNIMPTLTHDEYRKQFNEVFEIIHDLGQNVVFPNTTRIELREFEVFGKRWSDDINTI